MRAFLVGGLPLIVAILVIGMLQLGLTPAYVIWGPGVAAGIGAKLLCSAEHVIGVSRERAFADVAQYSSILEQVDVTYDDDTKSVTASFLGLASETATFLPGIGCAIDFDEESQRYEVATRTPQTSAAPWPAGNSVATIIPPFQAFADSLVASDNQAGYNTRALLVVRNGQIVAESYAQETDETTPLLGWSMAKSMTAILLGNLEMRGLLDLSDKPGFPGWETGDRAEIAITDLLTMTDGLDFTETYEPGDNATSMLFREASASDYAMQSSVDHAPGTFFSYSSGTANLLARIQRDVLGSPQASYDDLLDQVFTPMGMQNATFELDASGSFVGSSYLYASARDWARMGQLMLNGGELNGQRIVNEDWVKRATTPNTSDNEKAYGYQWWLNAGDDNLRFGSLPSDAYFANGNRQQVVMVFPSFDTVIVRLGWTSGWYPVDNRFESLLLELSKY